VHQLAIVPAPMR